ncbi:SCO family protein [Halobacteriovorax sp. HLS]|uniref:SCO family protein n=1 Tax=Halobacteriovorax sp. HLS TaxID=2234000 RepID=UPI000FD8285E|nr:SCO family protein [Halobacteriovorax sp. HLS]
MTTRTGFIRKNTLIEKLVLSKLFWFLLSAFLFSYPIIKSVNRTLPPPLPKMYKVPEYSLTNSFNKPFGSKDLKGRLYIAGFMFTSCPTTCPALMEKMDLIQKRVRGLGQKIAIVTFSVDPEVDTPQVLHKYARKRKANPFVWTFLTGRKEDLRSVIIDGFKVPMGEREPMVGNLNGEEVTLMDIAHSEKFVLVDWNGYVREYYSTDKNGINKMMIDVGLLVNSSEKR